MIIGYQNRLNVLNRVAGRKGGSADTYQLFYDLITDGTDSVREGARVVSGNLSYVVDAAITPTGFAGTEGIDWENILVYTIENATAYRTGIGDGEWVVDGLVNGAWVNYYEALFTSITSATVEDAASTNVVITFGTADTNLVAADFTITGITATVNSISRDVTNKIFTLVLNTSVIYGDLVTVNCKGQTVSIVNNTLYSNSLNRLFAGHVVGLFPLNETSGTVSNDLSGNDYDGAYEGTFSLNQSLIIESNTFKTLGTGNLDFYSAGLASKINFLEGFFSIWIANSTNTYWSDAIRMFCQFGADASNRIYIQSSSDLWLYAIVKAGGSTNTVSTGLLYGTRGVNIGIRWSKTGNKITMFINGVKQLPEVSYNGTWAGALGASYSKILSGVGAYYSNCRASHGLLLDYAPTNAEIFRSVNPASLLLFEGDSRTDKALWCARSVETSSSVSGTFMFAKKAISNGAVAGSTISIMATRASTINSILFSGRNNTLIIWIGVNDYASTAQQIFDAIKTYCQNAKASGWNKIIICTEINSSNAGWSVTYLALNILIKADNSFYDGLADLGARVELQNYSNTTYFTADGVHLRQAGSNIVATVVGNTLASLNL